MMPCAGLERAPVEIRAPAPGLATKDEIRGGGARRSAAESGAAGILKPGLILVADELIVEVDAPTLEGHRAYTEGRSGAHFGDLGRLRIEGRFILG